MPSSLSLKHGDIYYRIKVNLDIPWAFDEEVKVPLWIISRYDLNLYPSLKTPKDFESCQTITPIFGNVGKIVMTLHVPHTGWVSNQSIPFNIGYINLSTVNVHRTSIKLLRHVTYTDQTRRHEKVQSNWIMNYKVDGVEAGKSKNIRVNVKIPDVSNHISNEIYSRFITIRYFVVVVGKIKWLDSIGTFSSNPKIGFPVIIGNIALRFDDAVQTPQPNAPEPEENLSEC